MNYTIYCYSHLIYLNYAVDARPLKKDHIQCHLVYSSHLPKKTLYASTFLYSTFTVGTLETDDQVEMTNAVMVDCVFNLGISRVT